MPVGPSQGSLSWLDVLEETGLLPASLALVAVLAVSVELRRIVIVDTGWPTIIEREPYVLYDGVKLVLMTYVCVVTGTPKTL